MKSLLFSLLIFSLASHAQMSCKSFLQDRAELNYEFATGLNKANTESSFLSEAAFTDAMTIFFTGGHTMARSQNELFEALAPLQAEILSRLKPRSIDERSDLESQITLATLEFVRTYDEGTYSVVQSRDLMSTRVAEITEYILARVQKEKGSDFTSLEEADGQPVSEGIGFENIGPLTELLKSFDELEKRIIVLKYIDNKTNAEIAKELGLSLASTIQITGEIEGRFATLR